MSVSDRGARSRTVHAALLGLVALTAGQHVAAAAFPTRLAKEPMFGLYFAPARVHFDTIRLADMPEPCRKRLLADYVPDGRLFIYADQTSPTARLLVVGDKNGGVLLAIRGGACVEEGVSFVLLQKRHGSPNPNDAPFLSPAEIREIFAEVLARYTRAFGGRQRFFAWLDTLTPATRAGCEGRPDSFCPPTYRTLPADLQTMLEALRQG